MKGKVSSPDQKKAHIIAKQKKEKELLKECKKNAKK